MRDPIYDIEKSYLQNLEEGPRFSGKLPMRKRVPKNQWVDFLGFKIASRLGVPAGPLLDSKWVSLAGHLGFDVLTYKTIRSLAHSAHTLPNMVYVNTKKQLGVEQTPLRWSKTTCVGELSLTNSFGMPSRGPKEVVRDIARAKKSLAEGQVLIVSVVGTPKEGEDFKIDFVKAALLAKEGGANIIEANFSCPNVLSNEGSIYSSAEAVFTFASALKKALPTTPLIIKVGPFFEKESLKQILVAAARAKVDGVCGINTLKRPLLPPLSPKRGHSGICGAPIRDAALLFTKLAYEINQQEKLGLTLLSTGGVTKPEHFDLFFEAGAHVAMSAVGMMWDPLLASKYHAIKGHHA